MMSGVNWGNLAVETLRDPKSAARQILAWGVPRDVLWQALALVAIVNTLIFSVSEFLLPSSAVLPPFMANPFAFFLLICGGLVLTVFAIYTAGMTLRGKGSLNDLFVLLIWLQALRAAVQLAVLILMFVSPVITALLIFLASLFGLWVLLNFVYSHD